MKVLIVDDESLIRMDLRDQLEAADYEVIGEGRNGVEALKLAKKLKPDVILMDVKMPELDGIEAARQIRHNQWGPVVLLTAYSQQDLVKKAGQSGVYGYLIKPVREDQLVPTLEMAYHRYAEELALKFNIENLENTLEERKLIAKATGILQSLYQITEDEAYKRLRSFSMDKHITLVETCHKIISASKKRSV
ncbi:ANTAR domain-containing response regulator [Veillonella criceti]|uniref:Probable transcriptional regulatory protein pdtaR n=1 Tax=Veillonella criceti TaxID=103891 RepID=A0A380NHX8_9FIRM|nr:response regulator [Veillonella criceti]SUP40766.1 Probable transcriptional regulatory protein pdtaR [Veillonella criceti]